MALWEASDGGEGSELGGGAFVRSLCFVLCVKVKWKVCECCGCLGCSVGF